MISKVGGLRWNFFTLQTANKADLYRKRAPANKFYYIDTVGVKRDLLWPQRKKKTSE